MRISKISSITALMLLAFTNVALAQEAAASAPAAIPNVIGSIIGLILLIGMCYGVAKVALKKD